MVWSDYAQGTYEKEGWDCENKATCGGNQTSRGKWRWFCEKCLEKDFCCECHKAPQTAAEMKRIADEADTVCGDLHAARAKIKDLISGGFILAPMQMQTLEDRTGEDWVPNPSNCQNA